MTVRTTEAQVVFSCISGVCHRLELDGGPVEHPTQGTAIDFVQCLRAIAKRNKEETEESEESVLTAVEAQLTDLENR